MDPRSGTAGDRREEPSSQAPAGADWGEALLEIRRHMGEIRRELLVLVRVQIDRVLLVLRKSGQLAVWGLVGAPLLLAAVVTAAVLAVVGFAGGLAALFGGIQWAGNLVGGLVVLGGLALALGIAFGRQDRAALRRKQELYAHLRNGGAGAPSEAARGRRTPPEAE